MIKEIQAKVILGRVRQPDDWFGLYYNLNLYRGCQHQCIYCDSRSECYQIENFADILVKANAVELLRRELKGKRVTGTIGTGSMNDPYMPLETEVQLTRRAMQAIAEFGFPVHVITKSDLVLRDLELLEIIRRKAYAAVTFTITTADDNLGRKLEPNAPSPSRRLAALKTLAENGILTGVAMMPILPFIEDTEENIQQVVEQAARNGAKYILPAWGVTLRDRQRAYFYQKLDGLFPGLRSRYEEAFGGRYFAPARNTTGLEKVFSDLCQRQQVATRMPAYPPRRRSPREGLQPELF